MAANTDLRRREADRARPHDIVALKLAVAHTVNHVAVESKVGPTSGNAECGANLRDESHEIVHVAIEGRQAPKR